ncbi:MAG: SDR family oxidoreductase [Dehalococcoidales bacterium]|jgi:NAD(P)-dependent dehydrogenase (short-subunit alcohol dehydrogenase family)|nr:SDR family oxidoreductase [Dehalococcoidales bacterium]
MNRVQGKVAIVTGGSSGIGEATAKLLAKEGAKVAIVDIDDANGERVVSQIKENGGIASFWHLDISIEKEVQKVFAEIYQTYGQLNILVNNAGVAGRLQNDEKLQNPRRMKFTHEISTEDWDYVMNINLKGTFFCVKYGVPYIMKSGPGSVINVSSIMGIMAGPTQVYNTSKAAIRHMTKNDAVLYAKYNIRFNSVHPGFIITPLFEKLAARSPLGVKKSIEAESAAIPLGRMGLPEDIAYGILFLASDESSYITGTELVIDGGKLII